MVITAGLELCEAGRIPASQCTRMHSLHRCMIRSNDLQFSCRSELWFRFEFEVQQLQRSSVECMFVNVS